MSDQQIEKRQIVDEERFRLTARYREVTKVVTPARLNSPDGFPIPGTALVEFLPGHNDATVTEWLNNQGPFFNPKGEIVRLPLEVHAAAAHRCRTVGRLHKKGPPLGQPLKGPSKAELLVRLEAAERRIGLLSSDAQIFTDRFNKVLDTLSLNQIASVRHLAHHNVEAHLAHPNVEAM